MAKNHWLVKSEPETYSWSNLVVDKSTVWTGVRNFQARNNLRSMKQGDLVFFYHSVTDKQIVGLAKVSRTAYPDPTAKEGDWSAVDLAPVQPLKRPVTLAEVKAHPLLKDLALVRHSRLSVTPVAEAEARVLLKLAETKQPSQ